MQCDVSPTACDRDAIGSSFRVSRLAPPISADLVFERNSPPRADNFGAGVNSCHSTMCDFSAVSVVTAYL
jgi:hypothetical protein